jgi:thiol-disulfide isomerase/thioredoxin
MKRFTIIPVVFLLFLAGCHQGSMSSHLTFRFSPNKPTPNDTLTIQYNPENTGLAGTDSVYMAAYQFDNTLKSSKGQWMKKKGETWVAQVVPQKGVRGMIVTFQYYKKKDTNNKKGYIIPMYNREGNIVTGETAALAVTEESFSPLMDLKINRDTLRTHFLKDFNRHPGIWSEFLINYYSFQKPVYEVKTDSVIQPFVEHIEKKKDKTLKDYRALAFYTKYVHRDKKKHEEYKDVILKKYPESKEAHNYHILEIYNERDPVKKREMAEKFLKKYPDDDHKETLRYLEAGSYLKANDYQDLQKFLERNRDELSEGIFSYVVIKLRNEHVAPNTILTIAGTGVKVAERNINNPSGGQPRTLTELRWKFLRQRRLADILYLQGLAFNAVDSTEKAQKSLQKAVTMLDAGRRYNDGYFKPTPKMDSAYAGTLIKNHEYDRAYSFTKDRIGNGYGNPALENFMKEAYVKVNGSDKGYAAVLARIDSTADQSITEKLRSKMLNKQAPLFKLADLNGNEVSLSKLKGKIVIVDFWATWCGPCKGSFPMMKKVVQKYSSDPDVVFLFVDTWEQAKNKQKNAADFIKSHNYPFHVLLDNKNKVIYKYGVKGIPTKYVIDKNGNIRFMEMGYDGNDANEINNLTKMISMVR